MITPYDLIDRLKTSQHHLVQCKQSDRKLLLSSFHLNDYFTISSTDSKFMTTLPCTLPCSLVLTVSVREDEDDYEYEIFSVLSSVRALTSVILAGKRNSRCHSAMSFSENSEFTQEDGRGKKTANVNSNCVWKNFPPNITLLLTDLFCKRRPETLMLSEFREKTHR